MSLILNNLQVLNSSHSKITIMTLSAMKDGEVLNIARYLDFKDIAHLSLTCKRFERVLRRFLSRSVTIRGHDLSSLKALRCDPGYYKQ